MKIYGKKYNKLYLGMMFGMKKRYMILFQK